MKNLRQIPLIVVVRDGLVDTVTRARPAFIREDVSRALNTIPTYCGACTEKEIDEIMSLGYMKFGHSSINFQWVEMGHRVGLEVGEREECDALEVVTLNEDIKKLKKEVDTVPNLS